MQYLILANEAAEDFAKRDDPVESETYWAAWSGYIAALAESGILVSAAGLLPPETATTLRTRDGEPVVEDGKFLPAEFFEQGSGRHDKP